MAVNKVVQSNGTTLIDISPTTAVASDVFNGKVFFLANGNRAVGTAESNDSGYTRTVVVPEQTVTPVYHSDSNTNGYSAQLNNVTEMLEQWAEYIVTFNGTEYYFTTLLLWGTNYLFGEQAYLWSGDSGTNYPYPFCVISTSINDCYIYTASADSVTVKIEKLELNGSGGTGEYTRIVVSQEQLESGTLVISKYYTGTEEPADSLGSDGDIYLKVVS